MGRQIMQFERALEAQDMRVSRQAARTFAEALEYFEHQSFLNLDS